MVTQQINTTMNSQTWDYSLEQLEYLYHHGNRGSEVGASELCWVESHQQQRCTLTKVGRGRKVQFSDRQLQIPNSCQVLGTCTQNVSCWH